MARTLPGATEKSAPSVTCNRSASSHRHDAAVPSSDTVALVNIEAQSEGVEGSTARMNVTVIDLAASVKVAFQARGGCNVGLPVIGLIVIGLDVVGLAVGAPVVGLAVGVAVTGANVTGAAVVGLDVVGVIVLGLSV